MNLYSCENRYYPGLHKSLFVFLLTNRRNFSPFAFFRHGKFVVVPGNLGRYTLFLIVVSTFHLSLILAKLKGKFAKAFTLINNDGIIAQ